MPSFISNDVTLISHNKKLDFPSNFSTSNLVVIVFLALALILIVENSNKRMKTLRDSTIKT